MTPEVAAWRPGPERPNIWEIAVHCAYWKHIVLRRIAPITDRNVESFPFAGSDWFPRPGGNGDERAWKADLKILGTIHAELRDAVAALSPGDLTTYPGETTTRIDDLVRGIAFHDVHHGGQVQVLKKLWTIRPFGEPAP